MRLGIEPERSSELSALARDDLSVVLLRVVNLRHELRINRGRDGATHVETRVAHHHRPEARLPHGDNHGGAVGEELGCLAHGGFGEVGAVVGDEQPLLPAGHC